jgi:hypothetical protein
MTAMTAETVPAAAVSYASHAGEDGSPLVRVATAKKEPGKDRFTTYRFDQTIFPWEGGKFRLRLRESPTLILNPETVKVSVKDWGIELNIADAPRLPKYIVRRFLGLWSKAQEGSLKDNDAEAWAKIVDNVDMQDFAIQRSVPRYVEGELIAVRDLYRVRWHDGVTTFIPRELAYAFDHLVEGECFSAYVKFGPLGNPLSIERVLPVPHVAGV